MLKRLCIGSKTNPNLTQTLRISSITKAPKEPIHIQPAIAQPVQSSVLEGTQPLHQQQQLTGHKWADYSLISQTTRNAITSTLKYEQMTLVQDSVLTVLFGATAPPTQEGAIATNYDMKSLELKVTTGFPSSLDKEDSNSSREMKIREYLNGIEAKKAALPSDSEDLIARQEQERKLYASDLLVRSKTGTGKTLAFIVAAIETVLKSPEGFVNSMTPIVVLAPSRELAAQIKTEATAILSAHKYKACMFVGGEDRAKQIKKFVYAPYHLIVATPGRFLDVLLNEPKLKKRMRGLKVLIYDEADLLLDFGFQSTMDAILKNLPPPSTRQTFMFSATFSQQVKHLAADTLRHEKTLSLDTVLKSQVPTHLSTKQTHIHCPFSLQPQLLLHLIKSHRQSTPFPKIIVFFPTTHVTTHLSFVFNQIPDLDVMELHSQMDHRTRVKVSDRFRASRNGILFTSDVSARGVDYPDVSLVIQMGVPRNLEQYIHRIGRTGRAGKTGSSILVHSSYETPFLKQVLLGTGGLPIKRDTVHDPHIIARDTQSLEILKEAYRKGSWSVGSACYAAFLGYYRGLNPYMPLPSETLVKAADEFALGLCGLPQVPKVGSGLLTRLGLKVADGVKVLTPKEEAALHGKEFEDPNKRRFEEPGRKRMSSSRNNGNDRGGQRDGQPPKRRK